MFQFSRFALPTLCVQVGVLLAEWVSPFGHLRIKALLPAPRSFSQAYTSFVAYHRQGIHQMHLFAWSYNLKHVSDFRLSPLSATEIVFATHNSHHVAMMLICDWYNLPKFIYFKFEIASSVFLKIDTESFCWFQKSEINKLTNTFASAIRLVLNSSFIL